MNEKPNAQRVLLTTPKTSPWNTKHLLALSILLASYMASVCIHPFAMGFLDTLIIVLFIASSLCFLRTQYPITLQHYKLITFLFISCIPNAIFDNYFLKTINTFFIFLLFSYILQSVTHKQITSRHQKYMLFDLFNATIVTPIKSYISSINDLFHSLHFNQVKFILIGIILSIPILFIVLPLLSSADQAFHNFILNILFKIDFLFSQAIYIVVSLLLFCYFYPLLYGHIYTEKKSTIDHSEEALDRLFHNISFIPSSIFITLECILIIVYTLFILISFQDIVHNLN